VNKKGTFIDGLQISDVNISNLNLTDKSTIRFKLSVNPDSKYVGGLTIYGKNFGNYNQDIKVKLNYSPIAPAE
jgi:predicted transcriptional regulator